VPYQAAGLAVPISFATNVGPDGRLAFASRSSLDKFSRGLDDRRHCRLDGADGRGRR
jgi:hypothetical protein